MHSEIEVNLQELIVVAIVTFLALTRSMACSNSVSILASCWTEVTLWSSCWSAKYNLHNTCISLYVSNSTPQLNWWLQCTCSVRVLQLTAHVDCRFKIIDMELRSQSHLALCWTNSFSCCDFFSSSCSNWLNDTNISPIYFWSKFEIKVARAPESNGFTSLH